MEVGLRPGHIVLDGNPAPLYWKGHSSPSPLFGPFCSVTVAYLSNCCAVVLGLMYWKHSVTGLSRTTWESLHGLSCDDIDTLMPLCALVANKEHKSRRRASVALLLLLLLEVIADAGWEYTRTRWRHGDSAIRSNDRRLLVYWRLAYTISGKRDLL